MNVKDILTQARDLYADSPNHAPASHMPYLGTYCMITAVCCAKGQTWGSQQKALDALYQTADTESLVDYNAAHSTEEVLAVFDRAIEGAA